MKRLLVTLAIVLSFISLSSFKNNEGIAPAALQSFQTSFKTATDVNWSVSGEYFKASFALNGQVVSAYYDAGGKLMGLTRNISSLQLPIALQASLKQNFDCYWISDLFETATDEGTSYYITLENADTKLVLKSNAGTEWNVYKKQRKS